MEKKVRFSATIDDTQVLTCPRCGFDSMHQELYEIWNRKKKKKKKKKKTTSRVPKERPQTVGSRSMSS